jgi:hypothetical protein
MDSSTHVSKPTIPHDKLRELKTPGSYQAIAMTPETAALLTAYINNHWQQNPAGLLFPNRRGRPRKREHMVKFGLKPILRKLGLPTKDVGLHAFRHGVDRHGEQQGIPGHHERNAPTSGRQVNFAYMHSDIDEQRRALETIQSVQCAD